MEFPYKPANLRGNAKIRKKRKKRKERKGKERKGKERKEKKRKVKERNSEVRFGADICLLLLIMELILYVHDAFS